MKGIRLQELFKNKYAYEYILQIYREAKRTRDIHKILVFKSFIARIMDAQWEYDEDGRKSWAELEQYVTDIIMKESNPLKFIIDMAQQEHAYGYKLKRDLRRTF